MEHVALFDQTADYAIYAVQNYNPQILKYNLKMSLFWLKRRHSVKSMSSHYGKTMIAAVSTVAAGALLKVRHNKI